jgi:hypothetical protein
MMGVNDFIVSIGFVISGWQRYEVYAAKSKD